jgi:hypothetical protein
MVHAGVCMVGIPPPADTSTTATATTTTGIAHRGWIGRSVFGR